MAIVSILAGIFLICCIIGAVEFIDRGYFWDAVAVVLGCFFAIVLGLTAIGLIIGGVAGLVSDDTPKSDSHQSQTWDG